MPGRHRQDYSTYEGPPEEREQFIRDNPVAVADDLLAKITRQRKQLSRQDRTIHELKRVNADLRSRLGEPPDDVEGTQLREQVVPEENQPSVAALSESVPRIAVQETEKAPPTP